MGDFKRENKYIVLKIEDVDEALSVTETINLSDLVSKIAKYREYSGKEIYPQFVCVKSTWPMYEQTWKSIEDHFMMESKGG